jgi:UDPglucose 6-dehydrogenase
MREQMRVSIIGSGVVGVATGKGLVKLGYTVTFHDTRLNRLKELRAEGYEVTHHIRDAVMSTSISFVCVPTLTTENGEAEFKEKMPHRR